MKTLVEVIEEMFMHYVRSEEYVGLNEAGRNEFVDQVEELKRLVTSEK